MRRYSLAELQALPDLTIGQADTLKVEQDGRRVWLSRCTAADGEPFDHAVTVEMFDTAANECHGGWVTVERYPAS